MGAGLSTSAGIRDFRGKNGVWTELLSKNQNNRNDSTQIRKKLKLQDDTISDEKYPTNLKPFDQAEPTSSHMCLKELCDKKLINHIVSQNVDGLFLKCGLERRFISELHGNFYLDECTRCRSRFIRTSPSKTMRLQKSAIPCPRKNDITDCKGFLRDTILDWESSIPSLELRNATKYSKVSKLHICIGTTLQLSPSKELICDPTKSKSKNLVIINLQETKFDIKADLVIHYYCDYVMQKLMENLQLEVPHYDTTQDPTKNFINQKVMWKR